MGGEWVVTNKGDQRARAMADRHYTRGGLESAVAKRYGAEFAAQGKSATRVLNITGWGDE